MADTYAELQALSLEELKARYDRRAESTQVGLGFYREEIARREAEAQNGQMLAFTKQMRDMTIAIVAMTAVNIVVAGVSLFAVLRSAPLS